MLVASVSAIGESVADRFIVELTGEPAAGRMGHAGHPSDAEFRARLAALKRQHAAIRTALESKGAQVLGETSAVTNMLFVRMPGSRAGELASVAGVRRVYPVRLYRLVLDHALPLEHVPEAWDQIGGEGRAGAGIKVALVDTGIDPHHPAFRNAALVPPPGFPIADNATDAVYTSNKIIVARSYSINQGSSSPSPAIDTQGHGTGIGMIVAGSTVKGTYGPITGIAPQAFLGNYKVFPDDPNGRAQDDWIISAIDDAVLDGMDIITLSLGTPAAGRPVDDPLAQAVEGAVAAGKIVTISAGNGGPDPNTISTPGIAPDAITVGSRPNDRIFAGSVRLPGLPPLTALPGDGPNAAFPIAGVLADVARLDPSGLACGQLPAESLHGKIALILRGVCFFSDKLNSAQQAGAIGAIIYNDAARQDLFEMGVGGATLPAVSISYATGAALRELSDIQGIKTTLVFSLTAAASDANHLSSFSSRGPSSDSSIKPDLLAVGETVYTASLNSGYTVESGTSFSAPMVAGAAALLEAARPGLTAAQYRSLLINSAAPMLQDSGNLLPVQQEGAGFLNMLGAVNGTAGVFPTSLSFGVGGSTFDQTQTLALTNLGSAPDTFSISVQPLGGGPAPRVSANTMRLNPGQSGGIAVEFAGSSLESGAYQGYLAIQGTETQAVSMVPYWYGVPSGVAANITVLEAPPEGAENTQQNIIVRPTDSEGLAVGISPSVTATAGGGSVMGVQSIDDQIPGAFLIQVQLGPSAGGNVFRVAAGGAVKDIVIQAP